jgi:hypothetical protein
MLVAHKIALDPTNTQRSYFARGCGAAPNGSANTRQEKSHPRFRCAGS